MKNRKSVKTVGAISVEEQIYMSYKQAIEADRYCSNSSEWITAYKSIIARLMSFSKSEEMSKDDYFRLVTMANSDDEETMYLVSELLIPFEEKFLQRLKSYINGEKKNT